MFIEDVEANEEVSAWEREDCRVDKEDLQDWIDWTAVLREFMVWRIEDSSDLTWD